MHKKPNMRKWLTSSLRPLVLVIDGKNKRWRRRKRKLRRRSEQYAEIKAQKR
jgi:hypothetical protein